MGACTNRCLSRLVLASATLTLLLAMAAFGGTDDFFGREFSPKWIVHSTGDAKYSMERGWLHVDVPGQHWLNPLVGVDNMDGPMFLVEPPANVNVSFETHLRFADVLDVPLGAAAGLVIVRHSLLTMNKLEASVGFRFPHIGGTWWDVDRGGGAAAVFLDDPVEDLWLRFEHRGDTFGFAMREREDGDWEDITERFGGSFPHMDFRFEPGSYMIGLFVTSGLEPRDGVKVAFDYFHSPEISGLDAEAHGKAAVTWAGLRRVSR